MVLIYSFTELFMYLNFSVTLCYAKLLEPHYLKLKMLHTSIFDRHYNPFYQPFFPKSCTYGATLPPQRFVGVLHNHSSLDEDLPIQIDYAVRTGIRIPRLSLYL